MAYVTCDIGMSVDGYSAGLNQSQKEPLGEGGEQLHRWMFEEPELHTAERDSIVDAGAFIMGRNMFGPVRGQWPEDEVWTGWWGEDPPYHAPVFVLTHEARSPQPMQGGTTFHFVTKGVAASFELAKEAAGTRNISIAGGAETVRQFLNFGLIDELRLHIAPVVLGAGERVFEGVRDLRLEQMEVTSSTLVTHVRYRVLR